MNDLKRGLIKKVLYLIIILLKIICAMEFINNFVVGFCDFSFFLYV